MILQEEWIMFEYNGYNFEPERKMQDSEKKDICTFSKHIKTDRELGMCDYDVEWKKHNYSWKDFYEASGDSQLDLFRCVENGKLYVPCEHELFEFNQQIETQFNLGKRGANYGKRQCGIIKKIHKHV